jgi:UDPglucose 6-dehydrogenase
MKVGVYGLWHLGCVTAACLASVGHSVLGIDEDTGVVGSLRNGIAPISEPGLDDLIVNGLEQGTLAFSLFESAALFDLNLLWVAFDTPVNDEDQADVEAVIDKTLKILPKLPRECVVLVSSQLPVGSVSRLQRAAAEICPESRLEFACSPENLRLGNALKVFSSPDRVILGTDSEKARIRLTELFAPIGSHLEWMSIASAEMTKHAINAFLATSVVFANEIAILCEHVGADAKEVERGLKTESRIGPKAYLSPGAAFAGGTLARDINFLDLAGTRYGLPIHLLRSVRLSNDEHRSWIRRQLENLFPVLRDLRVAIWGLAYKPGTDTLRRSSSVDLVEWLLAKGAVVSTYDPLVKELPSGWSAVAHRDTALAAASDAQVVIVTMQFSSLHSTLEQIVKSLSPTPLFIDPNRLIDAICRSGQSGLGSIRCLSVGAPRGGASA